jgi:hypothetical protein
LPVPAISRNGQIELEILDLQQCAIEVTGRDSVQLLDPSGQSPPIPLEIALSLELALSHATAPKRLEEASANLIVGQGRGDGTGEPANGNDRIGSRPGSGS